MAKVPFALAPALANNGVINYSTSEGIKIFSSATTALVDDPLFDCEANGLSHFLGKLSIRSQSNGWNVSVFSIPENLEVPLGAAYDFLSQYGVVSLAHVQDHALTYISTESRAAQDSMQLGMAIMKSLSVSGFNKVTTQKSEYMIGGQVAGVALLKVLIGVSHIDTNATTSHIRKELSDLDLYLPQIGYDVTKLNEHVKRLIENLQAQGESTYDLLVNLFKAYETVPDVKFKGYVETKKSDYEEGRGNIDANSLMLLCENKYKTMVLNQTWNAPSPEDEKIVALQAEVTKLQKAVKGAPSKRSTKVRAEVDGPTKKKRPDKPAWMIKAPERESPTRRPSMARNIGGALNMPALDAMSQMNVKEKGSSASRRLMPLAKPSLPMPCPPLLKMMMKKKKMRSDSLTWPHTVGQGPLQDGWECSLSKCCAS